MIFDVFTGDGDGEAAGEQLVVPKVSDELYRELYELVDWMMKAEPWEKMGDFQSFVIVDPETKDKRIAAVMGAGGSTFGLHLYQPPEGVCWYARVQSQIDSPALAQHLGQFEQRMLEVCLTDFSEADEFDDEIDEKFAPSSWDEGVWEHELCVVTFRSIHPGCPPWHPEPHEAALMAEGLRLLKRYYETYFAEYEWASFSPEFENDEVVISMPTFRLSPQGTREHAEDWKLEIEEFRVPLILPSEEVQADELFIARLAESQVKAGTCWEMGAIHLPQPILSEGKPVYALTGIVVPRESERVEGSELEPANGSKGALLRRSFAVAVKACGYLPTEVIVGSPLGAKVMQEVADSYGVKVTQVTGGEEMPYFTHAAQSLLQSPLMMSDEDEQILGDLETALGDLAQEFPGPEATREEQEAFFQKIAAEKPEVMEQLLSVLQKGEGIEASGNRRRQEVVYHAPKSKERYVFRVDLNGMKPPLWRRISLPKDASFFDLHRAIQAAFGWAGYHLHSFCSVGNTIQRLVIDWAGEEGEHFGWTRQLKETECRLEDFFGNGEKSVNYTYDFGDNWEHKVKLEKEMVSDVQGGEPFEILKGKGGFPIEDCGGRWGLSCIIDGTHEYLDEFEPEQVKELQEGIFHPELVSPRSVEEEMHIQAMMDQG